MTRLIQTFVFSLLLASPALADDWQVLFDGTSLDGWKAAENPASVRLEDGILILGGKRAHLFWMGKDGKATFKDFEAELVFRTSNETNGGLFFHTRWQDAGWPGYGLECQVNASHSDWRKTGSIYAIQDVREPGHADGEWVTLKLRVEGKQAKVWVNGKLHNTWTQPDDHTWKKKRIHEGTFALQAHDPGSVFEVKSFKVRPLAE